MKIKNKGKVYPSPSPSPSSSSVTPNRDGDIFSVLKLLPAAILALASVLSLEDREVLAYMITRSIQTTTITTSSSSFVQKKSSKKASNPSNGNTNHQKPSFDCDCFDCYRSYWFRWDSSPNRELIHQVIEAFEEHLSNGEHCKKKGKRRDKTARRAVEKSVVDACTEHEMPVLLQTPLVDTHDSVVATVIAPNDDVPSDRIEEEEEEEEEEGPIKVTTESVPSTAVETEEMAVVVRTPPVAVSNHKGLARKVLPDVLGILNSRLWSLWSPNV